MTDLPCEVENRDTGWEEEEETKESERKYTAWEFDNLTQESELFFLNLAKHRNFIGWWRCPTWLPEAQSVQPWGQFAVTGTTSIAGHGDPNWVTIGVLGRVRAGLVGPRSESWEWAVGRQGLRKVLSGGELGSYDKGTGGQFGKIWRVWARIPGWGGTSCPLMWSVTLGPRLVSTRQWSCCVIHIWFNLAHSGGWGGGGHATLQEALAELEVGLDDLRGHRRPEL